MIFLVMFHDGREGMGRVFDERRAIDALREVVENSPPIDGGGVAINLAKAVAAVVSAGQPDAVIPPRYDDLSAEDSWHRLSGDHDEDQVELRVLAGPDGCTFHTRINGAVRLIGTRPSGPARLLALDIYSAAAAVGPGRTS